MKTKGAMSWMRRVSWTGLGFALAVVLGADPAAAATPVAQIVRLATAEEAAADELEARGGNLDGVVETLEVPGVAPAVPVATPELAVPEPVVPTLPTVTYPTGGVSVVAVSGSGEGGEAAAASMSTTSSTEPADVSVGGLGMSLAPVAGQTAPAELEVEVKDQAAAQAAGVAGVLFDLTEVSSTSAQLVSNTLSGEVATSDMAIEPTVESTPRQVQVSVDYSTFAGAYGGDWASRLQIVQVPDCAAVTPGAAGCVPIPVASTLNDPGAQRVTAVIELPADGGTAAPSSATASAGGMSVTTASSGGGDGGFGVAAGASGPGGSWSASSLSPSASWTAGGSTGSFSWSYPLTVPTPPAGPTPRLALSYSSASLDARSPGSNSQASWVGDGWDLTTGHVERSYVGCSADAKALDGGPLPNNGSGYFGGDLCWGAENVQIVFDGGSLDMFKDGEVWRAREADGTDVKHLTGAANGDEAAGTNAAGEYWVVTTTDGTKYTFGQSPVTTLVVPVYANHPGEPGQVAVFKDSDKRQAYRWLLERVEDPSGNWMTYQYTEFTNHYTASGGDDSVVVYDRDAVPASIEYGGHGSTVAPYRVVFGAEARCIPTGGHTCALPADGAGAEAWRTAMWFDTPLDQKCDSSTLCPRTYSPAFFSTQRLAKVTTQARTASSWDDVESWTLKQEFRDPGDGLGHTLWLSSISHTGHAGSGDDIALDPVWFDGGTLPNRVVTDATAGVVGRPPLKRFRIQRIHSESGGDVHITYKVPEEHACAPGSVPGPGPDAQATNTKLCFPVKWREDDKDVVEYFHKYVVIEVIESGAPNDGAGETQPSGSANKVTSYRYEGGASWAKPTGVNVRPADQPYSDFRGFEKVVTTNGRDVPWAKGDSVTTTSQFYRGTGLQLTAGAPEAPAAQVPVRDYAPYRGQTVATWTTANGETVSQQVTEQNEPVQVGAAGPNGITSARETGSTVWSYTFDTNGAVQYRTKTVTALDEFGQPTRIEDAGDVSTTADDLCTTFTPAWTTNADLATANIRTAVATTRTVAVPCGTTPQLPAQLVADTLVTYDAQGRPTRTDVLDPLDGVGRVLESETAHDSRGRVTSVKDALGRETKTAYTVNAQGQTTETRVTGPTLWMTKTQVDPFTGAQLSTTDANGRVTAGTYDALGRLVAVRYPEHQDIARFPNPSVEYTYVVDGSGLNAVVTKNLGTDGKQVETSAIVYDGLLRPIQTQVPGTDARTKPGANGFDPANPGQPLPDGGASVRGRIVAHTYYDSAGRVFKATGQWWATGTPAAQLIAPPPVVAGTTTTEFDDAGRPEHQILWNGNADNVAYEVSHTVSDYDGATTLTIPPAGGTPTATTVDPRGHTVRLRQYLRDPRTPQGTKGNAAFADTGAEVRALGFQDTTYTYSLDGDLTGITDAAGKTWSYSYDWAGRQISASDPDGGVTTTEYDAAGQPVKTVDPIGNAASATPDLKARHTTLTSYDELGRVTQVADATGAGGTAGTPRARNTYDVTAGPDRDTDGDGDLDPTVVLGASSTSTTIVDGREYTSRVDKYDLAGRATSTTTLLPEGAPGLEALGTREIKSTVAYTAGGEPESVTYPGVTTAGGSVVMAAETVTTTFDAAGMAQSMGGGFGWGTYVADTRWDAQGRQLAFDLGTTYGAVATWKYDYATGRVVQTALDRERFSGTDLNVTYTYDDAGNVTSVKDHPTSAALDFPQFRDNQCFAYDALRRLTEAFTSHTGDCAPAGTGDQAGKVVAAQVGGAAPYWNQYAYDAAGNRTKLTEHETDGSGTTATTVYDHGDGLASADKAGPHAVTSAVTTTRDNNNQVTGTQATSYAYDAAGNQLTRSTDPDADGALTTQTLGWNVDGRLAAIAVTGDGADGENTFGDGEQTSVYTADGARLLRRDESGTTLYAGGQEIHLTPTGAASVTRYYSFAGQQVAVRTAAGLGGVTSLVTDPHGTVLAAVPNTDWTATSVRKQYTGPFGGTRDATADGLEPGEVVPGDRQFLGKTRDTTTGLTLLGARWYDESLGRFLSVDPQLDPANPAQLNAYVYSGNNPATWSDPTGENWFTKGAKSLWNKTTTYVKNNKAELAGMAAGFVVGAVLGAGVTAACGAIGFCSAGIGGVACAAVGYALVGAAAGAIEGAVTNIVSAKLSKKPVSWRSVGPAAGKGALSGAVGGLLGGPLAGKIGSKAGGAVIKAGQKIGAKIGQTKPAQAVVSAIRKIGGTCSFTGDTPVLMGDGTSKSIEDIKPGDKVTSTNPDTGERQSKTVEATWVHDDIVMTLEIDGQTIRTTEDHPFWSVTDQRFERADQLEAGENVLTGDGQLATVTAPVAPATAAYLPAWNLTVEGWHTYHVLTDGDRGPPDAVLVHNTCPDQHVALGLEEHAEAFSQKTGAEHLMQDKDWRGTVFTAANLLKFDKPGVRVSFVLDGMEGAADGVASVVGRSLLRNAMQRGGATDLEIAFFSDAGTLGKVDFFIAGKLQGNPFR